MDQSPQDKQLKLYKQKMETLERENISLKKSLYELSTRYSSISHKLPTFPLHLLLDDPNITGEQDHESLRALQLNDEKHEDSRKVFNMRYELKGHTGAVYTIEYSKCGRFIATGSFDKTVRIWDHSAQKELNCLKKHFLNVSDLSWSSDSSLLVSGGYDQTCKVWDVEAGKLLESFESEGFVQCVSIDPTNNNLFCSGTSRNFVCIYDRREQNVQTQLRNASMVNTITVDPDGIQIITGDAAGLIKFWDLRTGTYCG